MFRRRLSVNMKNPELTVDKYNGNEDISHLNVKYKRDINLEMIKKKSTPIYSHLQETNGNLLHIRVIDVPSF